MSTLLAIHYHLIIIHMLRILLEDITIVTQQEVDE